jgi:hypothetical protein
VVEGRGSLPLGAKQFSEAFQCGGDKRGSRESMAVACDFLPVDLAEAVEAVARLTVCLDVSRLDVGRLDMRRSDVGRLAFKPAEVTLRASTAAAVGRGR